MPASPASDPESDGPSSAGPSDSSANLVRPVQAEGPSFPPLVKLLATALVAALGASSLPVLQQGLASWDAAWKLTVGTASVFVAFGYVTILTSRTGIDAERIYQTGLLSKQMALREITQVRLVRLPGLNWVVVPRLVARAGMMRALSFPTADARVLRVFELLAYGGSVHGATAGDRDGPASPR